MAKDGVMPPLKERRDATIHKINEMLPLNDTSVVNKNNYRHVFKPYSNRIERFRRHAKELNGPTGHVIILLLNVDDINGGPLSRMILPKHKWEEARSRKEKPFIRGLFTKELLCKKLDIVNTEAAEKLRDVTRLAIVVVDFNVIEIFEV